MWMLVVKHSRPPDLKSSSNVGLPYAWITGPATDASFILSELSSNIFLPGGYFFLFFFEIDKHADSDCYLWYPYLPLASLSISGMVFETFFETVFGMLFLGHYC